MIPGRLCNCGSPQTSHAWQKNPIPTLKRKRSDLNSRVLGGFRCYSPLETSSLGGKNFSNTSKTRSVVSRGEMDEEIDGLVTTNHLFSPNERRKSGFLLPIRLPNSSFLASKGNGRGQEGGGGGQRAAAAENAVSIRSHGIFVLKRVPCPIPIALKKKCPATSVHSHRKDSKTDFPPHFGLSASSQPCL